MQTQTPIVALTGAAGQLGQLVIDRLLADLSPDHLIATVRSPAKAAALRARGVQVRIADYSVPDSLTQAFAGVERLLLIASNEIGRRTAQHRNVIAAAKHQGVKLLVYTSLLHADTSPLNLAEEYRLTEAILKSSGVPFVILRNGWYTENYTTTIPAALANGAVYGSAAQGRISAAARADFAQAAATVLTGSGHAGKTYELAGDESFTLADLAAEISRQTGKHIPYRDLPEADYRAALVHAGLPAELATNIASWDAGAAHGALFDNSHQLRALLGRPTTPLAQSVQQALQR